MTHSSSRLVLRRSPSHASHASHASSLALVLSLQTTIVMFAQPLFRDSVDPVFVPTFGGGLYGPRPGAQQQPQQQPQPTFSHDEPYKRTTCVPTTKYLLPLADDSRTHTTHSSPAASRCCCRSPIVTGTSVVAIQHRDGVVVAADTLGTSSRSLAAGCATPRSPADVRACSSFVWLACTLHAH